MSVDASQIKSSSLWLFVTLKCDVGAEPFKIKSYFVSEAGPRLQEVECAELA